ncbi:MAG: hypothetical protein LBV27_07285 [Oscillospiraceae bacterium]|jgi:SPP1 gp7 family putative phage head morphogenesis protein|nr:hypothetical protein [Oscillospiraceae bacterium]
MTYWEQRAIDSVGRMEKAVNGGVPEIIRAFESAKQDLLKEISAFYGRYAKNNNLTLEEAQKALSLNELKDFKDTLSRYEKLARGSIGRFDLEVNNLSVKARITRLEALEFQCDAILQKLYQERKAQIEAIGEAVYNESYWRQQFNIEQYTGFQFSFSQPSGTVIQKVLEMPVQGLDISTRLWRQDMDTGMRIRQTLNEMFITGKPPQYFADELAKAIGAVKRDESGNVTGSGKKYEAYRLLYNESAQCMNQAAKQAYIDDDLEFYKIIATLDSLTSEICRALDGCVFSVTKGGDVPAELKRMENEYQRRAYDTTRVISGINYPAFHVNCRTTTAPEIPGLHLLNNTRIARDPVTGESKRISSKNYREWQEAHAGQDNRLPYKNPTEAWQRAYNRAVMYEPPITDQIKRVSDQVGMEAAGLDFRIKARDSYERKVKAGTGTIKEVRDILRYTLTASADDMADKMRKCIETLGKEGYNTIVIKNYWNKPYNPYNGVNTFVVSPDGQVFELQYHTPESFALKNGKLHDLYEKQRILSDDESPEYLRLSGEMFDLSRLLKVPRGIREVADK